MHESRLQIYFLYYMTCSGHPNRSNQLSYPPLSTKSFFLPYFLVKIEIFPGGMPSVLKTLFWAENRPVGPINFLPCKLNKFCFTPLSRKKSLRTQVADHPSTYAHGIYERFLVSSIKFYTTRLVNSINFALP